LAEVPIGHFERDLLGDEIPPGPPVPSLSDPFGFPRCQEAIDRGRADPLELARRLLIDLELAQRSKPSQFLLDQRLQPLAARPIEDLPERLQRHPHRPPVHRPSLLPGRGFPLKEAGYLPEDRLAGHARITAVLIQERAFPPLPGPEIPSQEGFQILFARSHVHPVHVTLSFMGFG